MAVAFKEMNNPKSNRDQDEREREKPSFIIVCIPSERFAKSSCPDNSTARAVSTHFFGAPYPPFFCLGYPLSLAAQTTSGILKGKTSDSVWDSTSCKILIAFLSQQGPGKVDETGPELNFVCGPLTSLLIPFSICCPSAWFFHHQQGHDSSLIHSFCLP